MLAFSIFVVGAGADSWWFYVLFLFFLVFCLPLSSRPHSQKGSGLMGVLSDGQLEPAEHVLITYCPQRYVLPEGSLNPFVDKEYQLIGVPPQHNARRASTVVMDACRSFSAAGEFGACLLEQHMPFIHPPERENVACQIFPPPLPPSLPPWNKSLALAAFRM